jgi:hypothetical protein
VIAFHRQRLGDVPQQPLRYMETTWWFPRVFFLYMLYYFLYVYLCILLYYVLWFVYFLLCLL